MHLLLARCLPAPAGPRPRAEFSPPLGPIISSPPFCQSNVWCVWPQDAFEGCSCHEFMQFVSRIQTPRLSEQEKVSCRRASFHVLRDSAGSARRRLGRAPNCVCAQIAKLTFRARSLGGSAAWVFLARCCILAAVLPREGVARIFVTDGRTHGRTGRPRNDLLQLGQTRFWKAAKAVIISNSAGVRGRQMMTQRFCQMMTLQTEL